MYKILIVDNEKDVLHTFSGVLIDEGYQVRGVHSEKDAIEAFSSEKFDFALIDVKLHGDDSDDISGLGLAAILRSVSPDTLVFMISGFQLAEPYLQILRYVTDAIFLDKAPGWDKRLIDALSNAKKVFQENKEKSQTISEYPEDGFAIAAKLKFSRLLVSIVSNQLAFVRSQGAHVTAKRTACVVNISTARYKRRVDNARNIFGDTRFNVKDIGRSLWDDIFSTPPEIKSTYIAANARSEILGLVFEGPREHIQLPIEFMYSSESDNYLVLQHPVARFINGVEIDREPINREFFQQKTQLKVLLIASNTPHPNIPGVDQEISELKQFLSTQKRFLVELEVIPTEKATINHIREKLRNPDYDIIHYAGHGSYNVDSPEESTLSFWSEEGGKGEVQNLKASEFSRLRNSQVRLVYLSSCWGTASGKESDLLDDDFLGMADAIVRVGVPTVLGYRWPVSDKGASKLALAFYDALLKDGRPEVALWRARQELAAIDRNDLTWLSPILIHQV
jgi:CheY-like chemotaxis protein